MRNDVSEETVSRVLSAIVAHNGRISAKGIASEIGRSVRTVERCLNKLQERGLVPGYIPPGVAFSTPTPDSIA